MEFWSDDDDDDDDEEEEEEEEEEDDAAAADDNDDGWKDMDIDVQWTSSGWKTDGRLGGEITRFMNI